MGILRLYDAAVFDAADKQRILQRLQSVDKDLVSVHMERCYHLEYDREKCPYPLALEQVMHWLVRQPLQKISSLEEKTTLQLENSKREMLVEIGPRFNFSTPYSTNCVNIFHNLGYTEVRRMENSTRYLLRFATDATREVSNYVSLLGDRMTHCQYTAANTPRESFDEQLPAQQAAWHYVPILAEGRTALERINQELGLAFTDYDLDYYYDLFGNILKRDPTTVELFDCAQSNSEHSRHWFFRGRMVFQGQELPSSLIKLIMDTQKNTNPNNTIKFSDNSSAIVGFEHDALQPQLVDGPGIVELKRVESDLIFTAETHNMPTAVAPFSGATTGTGGRLRDVQGVGRGGLPIAGTAGYCVGALHIPGYSLPYEPVGLKYPGSFAPPLQVLIEASDGASDYGNKFGEPLINGFTVSYGLFNAAEPSTREEYVKPIMFSGGLGTMPASMRQKKAPERGQLLAKIGGPVYRIGVGGGAASSVEVQGSGDAELDFNAVQRGDPEMENKLNRVVRACIELGPRNPILAIHDQGAGGNGNVLKELVEPGFAGAIIFSKEFKLGDPTITALELWGAEYQENNAILCNPEDRQLLETICARERCPISFVGVVTGDGRVTLVEQAAPKDMQEVLRPEVRESFGKSPFDLELSCVLGELPKRTYQLEAIPVPSKELQLPAKLELSDALERVLSIVAVGSKRFLTNKVDRCVGGLIVQQQCVGPLQAPLSDYALTTVSHFSHSGIATSIGTQPIMGLLSPVNMAHMCVAEALSNLVFVKISDLADIKCSGNWMWAAKLPGEGYKMYEACLALSTLLQELRVGIDGGKDSLSMAAKVDGEVIKSPGTLVLSTYAPCPDVRVRITPDLKGPARGKSSALLWINIEQCARLGGSALAQAYAQQGKTTPNMERTKALSDAFQITQSLLGEGALLAGKTTLSKYRGIVFPGGFSYADTLGSAKGWAANILHNALLRFQFDAFKKREDVFSLGICNGCQLMTLIDFVGSIKAEDESPVLPQLALLQNRSQRFECRWSTVRIPPNRSIMLSNMEDLVLGCWVAHGEGRFAFQDEQLLEQLQSEKLVTLQYVDDKGVPTELYPMNPNGSPQGLAGLCSPDGRHLALMPHPERCSAMYQWPYVPPGFEVPATQVESPWQLMFNNAYKWCTASLE
ncbi:phosphoribosylformylglycinamidine synthase isoform X2 [Drosophila navojoa]|uniref:phosphoribosylformylglycinamidine synthase isoform X2 n=1 Tax=Drosophila navojoa TaxID=7232 RepID=UPI0011BFB5C4|nr:phosphoribosylformylglycinamidine synthase isoform X2 [Drosophila navojoa]